MKTLKTAIAMIAFVLSTLISCASDESPSTSPETEEVIMDHQESTFLSIAQGNYRGPNLLWFQDPNKPEESVSIVEVKETEINYDWQFRGKPQKGHMTFRIKGNAVEVDWVDTWHAADGFKCVGTHAQEEMKFLCTYGDGTGADWGWRTELSMPSADQFLIEMFNITPKGEEQIAVRILADRSD